MNELSLRCYWTKIDDATLRLPSRDIDDLAQVTFEKLIRLNKLLLPPRQSGGNSYFGLVQRAVNFPNPVATTAETE